MRAISVIGKAFVDWLMVQSDGTLVPPILLLAFFVNSRCASSACSLIDCDDNDLMKDFTLFLVSVLANRGRPKGYK